MSAFRFVQDWYAAHCDGEWEHEFGMTINTLDNPGWIIEIDIAHTGADGRRLTKALTEPGPGQWIWSWCDGRKFGAACDPASLEDAFARFRAFIEKTL
ncbi:Imm53 family immunity protein [Amycolatopsis sp. cg5]|uniref:Imm53 family immunity protein n=1 Tax=Amycolatopsis sp. cg5 TaxID=3238802 RepID=UPI0035234510